MLGRFPSGRAFYKVRAQVRRIESNDHANHENSGLGLLYTLFDEP